MAKPSKLAVGSIFAVIAIAIILLVLALRAEHATGESPTTGASSLSVISADGTTLGAPTQSGSVLAPQSAGLQQAAPNQALQNTGAVK